MNIKFKLENTIHSVCCEAALKAGLLCCVQAVSEKLMAGFVECLDNDEAQEGVEKTDGGSSLLKTIPKDYCS